MASQQKGSPEFLRRGIYASNPLGTATFIGLRSLDVVLQYQILTRGAALISKLGLATLPAFGVSLPAGLPLPSQILLTMATSSALKQIIWLLYLSNEEFPPHIALPVAIYNTVLNSANSLLLITAVSSAALSSPSLQIPGTQHSVSLPIAVGTALYAVGIATELVSEWQRKLFKDDPANKGKLCTAGLWGWARHINYGGYSLWRSAYALAAGSWPAAALVAAWHAVSFGAMSIPELDGYLSTRYGEQWKKYKTDVPYTLFPGIY